MPDALGKTDRQTDKGVGDKAPQGTRTTGADLRVAQVICLFLFNHLRFLKGKLTIALFPRDSSKTDRSNALSRRPDHVNSTATTSKISL